jgi:CRP/FNR family cyclic AMP-dependent transcriptional regulator
MMTLMVTRRGSRTGTAAAELEDTDSGRRRMLKRSLLLKDASGSWLDDPAKKARVERRPRGRVLFRSGEVGETVLLILEGRVRLSRSSRDDREYLVQYREVGELVGESLLCGAVTFRETGEAATDVALLLLPLRALRRGLEGDQTIALRLLQTIARRQWELEDYVERVLFRTVESRLAERIAGLATQYGRSETRGTLIDLKVTHAELSRAIGATRETVTLTLGALRRRGIIEFDRRRIVVRDPSRLQRLV